MKQNVKSMVPCFMTRSLYLCLRSAKNKQTKKCRRLVFTDSMYCFLMPSFVVFNDPVFLTLTWFYGSDPRTTDTQCSLFSLKSRTFELGQKNLAEKFWCIMDIFGRTISTNFGTVSPLSLFPNIQPLFLQKNPLYHPHTKYLFGIGI